MNYRPIYIGLLTSSWASAARFCVTVNTPFLRYRATRPLHLRGLTPSRSISLRPMEERFSFMISVRSSYRLITQYLSISYSDYSKHNRPYMMERVWRVGKILLCLPDAAPCFLAIKYSLHRFGNNRTSSRTVVDCFSFSIGSMYTCTVQTPNWTMENILQRDGMHTAWSKSTWGNETGVMRIPSAFLRLRN